MYSRAEATHEELLWQPFPNIHSIPVVLHINHDDKTVSVTDLSTGESFPCCPKCREPYTIFDLEDAAYMGCLKDQVCMNSTCEDYLA
jgi:hypothetical protein